MPKPIKVMSPSKCNRIVAVASFSRVRVSHEICMNGEWSDEGGVPLTAADARRLGHALLRLADWADATKRKAKGATDEH